MPCGIAIFPVAPNHTAAKNRAEPAFQDFLGDKHPPPFAVAVLEENFLKRRIGLAFLTLEPIQLDGFGVVKHRNPKRLELFRQGGGNFTVVWIGFQGFVLGALLFSLKLAL